MGSNPQIDDPAAARQRIAEAAAKAAMLQALGEQNLTTTSDTMDPVAKAKLQKAIIGKGSDLNMKLIPTGSPGVTSIMGLQLANQSSPGTNSPETNTIKGDYVNGAYLNDIKDPNVRVAYINKYVTDPAKRAELIAKYGTTDPPIQANPGLTTPGLSYLDYLAQKTQADREKAVTAAIKGVDKTLEPAVSTVTNYQNKPATQAQDLYNEFKNAPKPNRANTGYEYLVNHDPTPRMSNALDQFYAAGNVPSNVSQMMPDLNRYANSPLQSADAYAARQGTMDAILKPAKDLANEYKNTNFGGAADSFADYISKLGAGNSAGMLGQFDSYKPTNLQNSMAELGKYSPGQLSQSLADTRSMQFALQDLYDSTRAGNDPYLQFQLGELQKKNLQRAAATGRLNSGAQMRLDQLSENQLAADRFKDLADMANNLGQLQNTQAATIMAGAGQYDTNVLNALKARSDAANNLDTASLNALKYKSDTANAADTYFSNLLGIRGKAVDTGTKARTDSAATIAGLTGTATTAGAGMVNSFNDLLGKSEQTALGKKQLVLDAGKADDIRKTNRDIAGLQGEGALAGATSTYGLAMSNAGETADKVDQAWAKLTQEGASAASQETQRNFALVADSWNQITGMKLQAKDMFQLAAWASQDQTLSARMNLVFAQMGLTPQQTSSFWTAVGGALGTAGGGALGFIYGGGPIGGIVGAGAGGSAGSKIGSAIDNS